MDMSAELEEPEGDCSLSEWLVLLSGLSSFRELPSV